MTTKEKKYCIRCGLLIGEPSKIYIAGTICTCVVKEKINDYVLRLGGKVSLLEPVSVGHNYSLKIEGSITEETLKDNSDGTFNKIYKIEPVRVELISPLGETIKGKDPRSKSKLLRACLYKHWKEIPNDMSDEDFYDSVLNYIISNSEKLAEKAIKEFTK